MTKGIFVSKVQIGNHCDEPEWQLLADSEPIIPAGTHLKITFEFTGLSDDTVGSLITWLGRRDNVVDAWFDDSEDVEGKDNTFYVIYGHQDTPRMVGRKVEDISIVGETRRLINEWLGLP